MFPADAVALVAQLTCADLAGCDRSGLAVLVSASQRVRDWLDALDARIAQQASRLAERGGEDAATVLIGGGRRAGRDARQTARRGEVCAEMPGVHDALARGSLSAGHVDAIARAAGQLDDAGRTELAALQSTLVESAKTKTVEAFEREVGQLTRLLSRDDGMSYLARLKQQRMVRRWMDRVGMCHTHIELDPETDARVAAAFDAAIQAARAVRQDDVNFDHLRTDALVDLITGARSTDRRVPEVVVLIDHDTLTRGVHEHSIAETNDGVALPVDTIRRLGCDANIIPVVLGGPGIPLDHGRARRLATREQRRALRTIYQTCGHPGCTVRFEACRIHHVDWWEHHGPTDLANLLPLCERHHHLVHEGQWTLTIDPDRTLTVRCPDGTISFHGATTRPQQRPPPRAPAA